MATDLVLWDWNGTLLDDLALCVDALNQMLSSHGYSQQYDTDSYREIFGFPIKDYYVRAGFDFQRHSFAQLAEDYMAHYVPASMGCGAAEGAVETLSAIQAQGIPQVILSASALGTLQKQVEQCGLSGYFQTLLGLTDIYAASKVEIGKRFMAESGIDPASALMVGDTLHDFQVAQALGCRCVLVSCGHHSRERLATTGVPVVDTLPEILNYL